MAARSAALDAVRVVGVAAVVVGHAIPNDAFRQILFAWHVPVFFFLSGYLWRAQRPFGDEVRARSTTLAGPYLFWLVVVGVLYVPLELSGWVGPAPTVSTWTGPLLGGANAHEPYTTFWFVSVLFFVALLYRLLSSLPMWVAWAVAVVGLIAVYFIGPAMAHTPLAIASAVPCLVFLLVGRMSRTLVDRVRAASAAGSVFVGIALVVVSEILVVTELVQPVDIKAGHWGTPVLAVLVACAISIGLVLIAEAVYARASERLATVTTSLAYAGLCVVLVHPVVQWLLRPFGPPLVVFVGRDARDPVGARDRVAAHPDRPGRHGKSAQRPDGLGCRGQSLPAFSAARCASG